MPNQAAAFKFNSTKPLIKSYIRSLVAYLQGLSGDDVEALDQALETKQLSLPPAVITEIMSDPKVPVAVLD